TTTCQSCHKAEQLTLCVDNYATMLGVDSSQLNTSSGQMINPLGIQSPGVVPVKPAEAKPAAIAAAIPANPAGNGLALGVLVVCFAGVAGYVWADRRKRAGEAISLRQRAAGWLKALTKPNWTPYSAGILLGLVCIIAVWVGNHLLASAGPMATVTSTLVYAIAKPFAENNLYFKAVAPPGLTWEVVLLIGVFLGGMLGALSSRTFKLRWEHDPTWNKVFGPSKVKRFGLGFLGAMILQYGASIAGGCTMGLAISGSMLLAPAGFLFMIGMFASGILVALLVYRRRY
ncbi:MAG TPA: YeeE/YedE thiosulfate transporter family protein, partial [Anaerolineaceae bacterium]|nr:YeeE/YedE thiosulfate transporter family protein [Anaerolineaceae bacterium]